jgi:protease-4
MSKSTKWFLAVLGILALIALVFVIGLVSFLSAPSGGVETVSSGSGDKIAVVELKGIISSSDEFVRQVKKYRTDRSIQALLIRIDSPGGGVVASQEMYEELRKTRDGGKPVIVSMGSMAASGGYYVACGASRVVANRGTLTGSIGVISEFLQLYEAMEKLGIAVKTVKSGRLKDSGNPARPMSREDEAYFQEISNDVHRQFVSVVERERGLSHAEALALSDGRVFTGEQAAENGLVDTLGTYEDAVLIAAEVAGIEGEPSLVRERKRANWWISMLGDAGETLREFKQEILDRPVLSYRFSGPQD